MPHGRYKNAIVKQQITKRKKAAIKEPGDSDVDPDDFYHDEIDDFHSAQEKILLSGQEKQSSDDGGDEEVYPITDGEDSDLEDGDLEDGDLEDEKATEVVEEEYEDDDQYLNLEDDLDIKLDDDLPNLDAWGKDKSRYYKADFVDKDWGKTYREEDAEAAKEEEIAAVAVRDKMLGMCTFKSQLLDASSDDEESSDEEMKVKKASLADLSEKDVLKQMKLECPEIFILHKEFHEYMTDYNDGIESLLPLLKEGRLLPSAGADHICLKHHIIQVYLNNIMFYFMLKSKGVVAKYHPVMRKLSALKESLNKLRPLDEAFKPEVDFLLEKLRNGEEIPLLVEENEQDDVCLNQDTEREDLPLKKKRKLSAPLETETEKEIESHYREMKKRRIENEDSEADGDDEIQLEQMYKDGEQSDDDEEGGNGDVMERRPVTYQIAKNKGILPYRNKKFTHPRVKLRQKFKKAVIRRKGQVREPKKELERYGGEHSGIRTNLIKSTKLH